MSTTCSLSYQIGKYLKQKWKGDSDLQLLCWGHIQIKLATLWKLGMKWVSWDDQIHRKNFTKYKPKSTIQGHDFRGWYLELWPTNWGFLGTNEKRRLDTIIFMLEEPWDGVSNISYCHEHAWESWLGILRNFLIVGIIEWIWNPKLSMIISWAMMIQILQSWYLIKAWRKENKIHVNTNLVWSLDHREHWPWR